MSGPTTTQAGPQIPKSEIRNPIFLAESMALLLILLLAAWLRLGWPGINSFGFDEARVSDMALQMARGGKFAALGMQSSTGVPNFAATVWFFALPYAISTNPAVANNLVALLNVLAVVGMWWLGRTAWGKTAGLVAGLLFAASPYLVFYSRSIWSQNLLAPLAILWAVAIVAGLKNNNPWLIGLHAFLAGLVGQIHFAGFALALASLWIGFRFRLWRWWTAVTAGLLVAGVLALPTITLIWRSGDGAKAVIRGLLVDGTATAVDKFAAWQQLRQLSLSQGWEKFWLNTDWGWPPLLAAGLQIGGALVAILVIIGALAAARTMAQDLRSTRRGSQTPTGREILSSFVLIWGVAAPLLFMLPRTPVFPQYQLVSLPALFLLAGGAVGVWPKRAWQIGVVGTAVFIASFQATAVAQTLTSVADTFVPGGMGTPLRYPQTAVRQLMADGRPIVVETFGDIPEFDGDAAMFKVLLWGYPTQIVDARHVLLIPDRPATLLFTYENLAAWEVATAVGLTGAVRELPRRDGELPYLALTVDDDMALTGFQTLPQPIKLANGAELLGWQLMDLPESGQIRLITHWQVTGEPQEGHFQQFNHLYLPGAEVPGDVQDVYTSSRAWQKGDHLITWVEFARPAEPPAYFHVGMYTWPDLQRSPVLGRDGMDPLYPIQLDWKSEK